MLHHSNKLLSIAFWSAFLFAGQFYRDTIHIAYNSPMSSVQLSGLWYNHRVVQAPPQSILEHLLKRLLMHRLQRLSCWSMKMQGLPFVSTILWTQESCSNKTIFELSHIIHIQHIQSHFLGSFSLMTDFFQDLYFCGFFFFFFCFLLPSGFCEASWSLAESNDKGKINMWPIVTMVTAWQLLVRMTSLILTDCSICH